MLKIAVIGVNGVGKTAYINRITNGGWEDGGNRSDSHNEHHRGSPLIWDTNKGIIHINIHKYNHCDLKSSGITFDGVIIMFADKASYECAKIIYDRIYGQSPVIVFCFNKCDIVRDLKQKNILFHRRNNITMHDVSARTMYNIEKPIVDIVEAHVGAITINGAIIQ